MSKGNEGVEGVRFGHLRLTIECDDTMNPMVEPEPRKRVLKGASCVCM